MFTLVPEVKKTVIPFYKRFFLIVHLCIVFSLMTWYLFQPFLGEYFKLKSRMLPYEFVLGIQKANVGNESLFQALSEEDRQLIKNDYSKILKHSQRSFLNKIFDGFVFFIFKIPAFELAWIFFSIVIVILMLLQKEGSKNLGWVLLFIVIGLIVDNSHLDTKPMPSDLTLFPSEKILFEEGYLENFKSKSWLEQKKQLTVAWQNYLIDTWSSPSEQNKLKSAEFNFNLARLKLFHEESFEKWLNPTQEKFSAFTIILFIVWSVLFLIIVF